MGGEPLRPFRVGEWTVTPSSCVVERGGERVRLGPTVMHVLVTLAARPGEVVSREEMLDAVWSGTFVTDEVLSNAVWELRRALGDDAKSPSYVQTVPRRGYRLVAAVDRSVARRRHVHRTGLWALVSTGLVAIVVWSSLSRAPGREPLPVPVRLTSFDGRERAPALSPDGRRVAFFRDFGLYVVSIEGGDPLLLSSLEWDGYFGGAAWSPDGEWIAFTRWTIDSRDAHEVRLIRALGGSERYVLTTLGYDGAIDWSPGGQWLVATGKESRDEPDAIFLYPADSESDRPKRLTTPPPGHSHSGDGHPRFSPDGARVAFLRRAPGRAGNDIFVQNVTGSGGERRVTRVEADSRFESFDWLADGSGFFAAVGDGLLHVALDSGEVTPLDLRESFRDVWVEGAQSARWEHVPESFFGLTFGDRRDALEAVALRSGRPAHLLEKDVWVVWTLRALFDTPFARDIVFKGGTSLSKAYRAIARLSEDIDLTYDIAPSFPIWCRQVVRRFRPAGVRNRSGRKRFGSAWKCGCAKPCRAR